MSGKKKQTELDKMFSLIEIWTVLKLVKCNISKDNFNLEQNTIQKKISSWQIDDTIETLLRFPKKKKPVQCRNTYLKQIKEFGNF